MDFSEAKAELQNAIGSYITSYRQGKSSIDEATLKSLLNRAERIKDLLRGSRILWVDDQPLANAAIFRFLNNYGVEIDCARTTDEAISALRWSASAYEVVVSDMKRDNDSQAGLDMLERIRKLKIEENLNTDITVFIFLNEYDPSRGTPTGAKMITNRVDYLFKEIFSTIEEKQLQHSDIKR